MTAMSHKTLLDIAKDKDPSNSERNSSEEGNEEKQNESAACSTTNATQFQTLSNVTLEDLPQTPPVSRPDLTTLPEDNDNIDSSSLEDSINILPFTKMPGEPNKDTVSRSSDDTSSLERSVEKSSSGEKTPDMLSQKEGGKSNKTSNKKSSNSSWYNVWTTSYKTKCEDFRRIFGKNVPESERLVVDYSCALQKDILVHGRLYLTQNWVCFYANIFRWETCITIRCKDITAITKEKTARVIPNAIQICTENEKYFFTSFGSRDKSFMILFRIWQNALLDQPMSPQDFWTWVRMNYGDEVNIESDQDIDSFTILEGKVYGMEQPPMENGSSNGNSSGRKAASAKAANSILDDISPESPNNHTQDSLQDNSILQSTAYAADESSINTESDLSFSRDDIPVKSSSDVKVVKSPVDKVTKTLTPAKNGEKASKPLSPVKPHNLDIPAEKSEKLVKTPSDELPTDESDFSEEDEVSELLESSASEFTDHQHHQGEVICPCTDHPGRCCMNDVYDFPADKLFEMLFSESFPFYREFLEARKTTKIVMFPWQDIDKSKMVRNMTYTLTLFASFGPKTSETSEVQTYFKDQSKDGHCYIVETDVVNHGIPYGDNFYVSNRYCITRVNSTQCRLRVHCEIKYRKSVWGLVKTIIEKNAGSGIADNYKMLDEYLVKASSATNPRYKRKKPTAAMRRRKHSHGKSRMGADLSDEQGDTDAIKFQTSTPAVSPHVSPVKRHPVVNRSLSEMKLSLFGIQLETRKFMALISVILLVLLLFNVILFYRLKSLELTASQSNSWQLQNAINSFNDIPKTSHEWSDLLKQQQYYHDAELERWREILDISIQLLDQMKGTLVDLKGGIKTSEERRPNVDQTNKT
ncbi:protein Aster-B-like [Glandiceps talaboti]